MRKRILTVFSAVIFLFNFLIVLTFHIWIRSNFKESQIKTIETNLPKIKKKFSRGSKDAANKLAFFIGKQYPDSELRLWDSEFDLIYPKGYKVSKALKADLYKNIEELQNIKSKNKRYIFHNRLNMVDIFFKLENKQTFLYILMSHPILSKDTITFLVYMYALAVLFTGLAWFIGFRFSKEIFSVLKSLAHSMKYFPKNQYTKTIDYNRDNEVGDMVSSYNHLISSLGLVSDRLAISGETLAGAGMSPKEDDPEILLPKSDLIEISMFPKTLENSSNLSVYFQKAEDHNLHLLMSYTAAADSGDHSWRNMLKEHFKGLVAERHDPEKIVAGLLAWADKNRKPDVGVFYGYFDPKSKEMSLFQAGHVTGFTRNMGEEPVRIESGSLEGSSDFTGLPKKRFAPGGFCILFSPEMLKGLGIDDTDLQDQALSSIDMGARYGKGILKRVLEKICSISAIEPSSLKTLSGCLILIFHKE